MASSVLACVDLVKQYRDGDSSVNVLSGVNLVLAPGESIAIVGRSGSGKSTLLNVLGGLDAQTNGSVTIAGRGMATMTEAERCQWRNAQLGFVFQFHHLLPEFTALEAVAMPARIGGMSKVDALSRAEVLLQSVGLKPRQHHRPGELSGGERQRVAIARALINKPSCVLMDEPTGNLDPDSAEQVLELMLNLDRRESAFIVVTHDMRIAQRMDRILKLDAGVLSPL